MPNVRELDGAVIKMKVSLNFEFKITKILIDMAPFVTLKCPPGYKRYGCCKCLRTCNNHQGLQREDEKLAWTGFDYCMKREQLWTEPNTDSKTIKDAKNWDIYKGAYVKKCDDGYERVGDYRCLAKCPLGWPDLGDRCVKQGALLVFPFVWQVGDGSVVVKKAKK